MEGKKISFGFTKTKKLEKPVVAEKREYIECLEEKSIKVVGGEIEEEKAPLVITMKPNTLITAERLKQIAEEVEKAAEEVPAPGDNGAKDIVDSQPLENETIDQMAVRELLNEAKQERKVEGPALTVPVPMEPILDGQKESTLEDYETVPIQEFGMAMLRGMGWSASKEQQLKHKQPELRPKGLGLGADKVIKENQKKNVSKDKKDEELTIVKNSFVKVTTGKYSGYYGKVVSLDDDNGRVMVDITIKKETVSLSEFMMQAVSKSEYDKLSKVINADSYEEYKKNEKSQKSSIRDCKKEDKEDREASSSRKYEHRSKNDEDKSKDDEHRFKDDDRKSKNDEHRSKDDDRRSKHDEHRSKDDDRRSKNDEHRSQDDERRSKDDDHRSKNDDNRSRRDKEDSSNGRHKAQEQKKYRSRSRSNDDSSKSRRKHKKRYSSNDSLSSLSDSERRIKKKDKKRYSDSSDSDDKRERRRKSSPEKKRDIDKKRKGKKKKRDRDRSPNYRKHRK